MALVLFLLLLPSICFTTEAQTRDSNISLGSSCSPTNNSYWLSASRRFAFGFYPYGNGFSLGYESIPQKTVVWTANRDEPPFPADATLLLSTDGRLVVQQKQGQETLIANASFASSASMLDSASFAHHNLVSDVSETNHARGKFQLIMQRNGNLAQYPLDSVEQEAAYWNTGTFNAGDNVTLNLDSNGQLYLINSTALVVKNITKKVSVSGKLIYRATIDADGIFRLYSHSFNQSGNWSIEWSSSNNRCVPKGLCGVNSYCTLMDREPVCQCPLSFDFIDQGQKDLGCQKNYSADACTRKSKQSFDVYELSSVTWEEDPYATLQELSKDDCREECFRDCNCEVALYGSARQICKKLKLPLRYGRRRLGGRRTTFVKIGTGVRTIVGGKGKKSEAPHSTVQKGFGSER
ncbi:hypothetical protein QUC31_001153 [Theobroma cacao]